MTGRGKLSPEEFKRRVDAGLNWHEEVRLADVKRARAKLAKGEWIMPMDFPNMASLKREAEVWKFRQPREGETEDDYRRELADFVAPHDFLESEEVRNKKGWDKFSEAENASIVFRSMLRNMK